MHCPNCRHILTKVQLDHIEVEHCNNCGGTIFEPNEINRLTDHDVERLSMLKQNDVISGGDKVSPSDGSIMTRIDSDSIPLHVTLLQSKTTGEVFAYLDDLVEFKKAQEAKIEYYKAWRIPLPVLQQVLVYSLIAVIGVGATYTAGRMLLFDDESKQSIQADSLCNADLTITKIQNGSLISCSIPSDLECTAEARLHGQTDGPYQNISISRTEDLVFASIPSEFDAVRFTCGTDTVTEWYSLDK